MSRVSRADWAPPTRWEDIIGKPSNFGVGVPGPRGLPGPPGPPSPTTGFLPAQFTLTWDIPALLPLQTATQAFNVGGVFPGNPLVFGWQFNPGFCWLWGLVTGIEIVTLYAKNMDAVPVTLGSGTWVIQRFT